MIPDSPNLPRLRADRTAKLFDALGRSDVDAVVLLGTTNVRWATGARVVGADQARSGRFRNIAVAVNGDRVPHLFTHMPQGVPADHPADHIHPGLDLEEAAGATALVEFVATHTGRRGRVLLDEWTMPLLRSWTARLPDVAVD